jgi:hypothetical protein
MQLGSDQLFRHRPTGESFERAVQEEERLPFATMSGALRVWFRQSLATRLAGAPLASAFELRGDVA